MSDTTPSGDPIDTVTIWLDFEDGEAAISADLTGWNAAWSRLRDTLGRMDRLQDRQDGG